MLTRPVKAVERLWCVSARMLLALFLGMLVTSVEAATHSVDEVTLRACCRAHGKHQCSMGNVAAPGDYEHAVFARLTEKCPCPFASQVATRSGASGVALAEVAFADLAWCSNWHAQTAAPYRLSLDQSNRKRGPPSTLPSA